MSPSHGNRHDGTGPNPTGGAGGRTPRGSPWCPAAGSADRGRGRRPPAGISLTARPCAQGRGRDRDGAIGLGLGGSAAVDLPPQRQDLRNRRPGEAGDALGADAARERHVAIGQTIDRQDRDRAGMRTVGHQAAGDDADRRQAARRPQARRKAMAAPLDMQTRSGSSPCCATKWSIRAFWPAVRQPRKLSTAIALSSCPFGSPQGSVRMAQPGIPAVVRRGRHTQCWDRGIWGLDRSSMSCSVRPAR